MTNIEVKIESIFRKTVRNDSKVKNAYVLVHYGYFVSTNFSISGDSGRWYRYIRYETADALFDARVGSGGLSAGFILTDVARSLKHSMPGIDLGESKLLPAGTPQYAYFREFTGRRWPNVMRSSRSW
jgi:hypothetical protein